MQALVERVQLAFTLKQIVDVCVASNQLYIAAGDSGVLRIDLDSPSEVAESRVPSPVRRLWPSRDGRHLIVQCADAAAYHFYNLSTGAAPRKLRLPGGFNCAAFDDLTAYLAIGHNVHAFELAPLKIARKRESLQKVYSHSHPIDGLALVDSLVVLLANGQVLSGSWDSLVASAAPRDSQLVASPSAYVLKTPNGVLNGGTMIEADPELAPELAVLSRFHILVYSKGSLCVYNRVSNKLVAQVAVPHLDGLRADPEAATLWAFSRDQLFEIKLENELLGMWQTYVDAKQFDEALAIASPGDRLLILKEYGDHEFASANYERAAQLYGQSSCHIEGLALRLLEIDPKLVVKLFSSRLDSTRSKVQAVVLSSWVVELLLQLHMYDELQAFCAANVSKLDVGTVQQLLKDHAQDDQILWFATLVKDTGYSVQFAVQHALWDRAVECLRDSEDLEAIYKYASVLLSHRPKQTVEVWMRIPRLDPVKLLPALLSYSASYKGPKGSGSQGSGSQPHQAIRYLRHTVKRSPILYNALVMIYAQTDDEQELLDFLREKPPFTPNYYFGLRVCLENNKARCAVYLYTEMKLYEEAVALALSKGLEQQATEIVDKVESEQQRRTLWIEIARHVVATDGTATALKFVDHLSIEDLLELFPNFETLDSMAPEVVRALESANSRLQSIHAEMESSKRAGLDLQHKIQAFEKRYAIIEPGEWCQRCRYPLATRRFYMFPCQHGFHLDCIVSALEQGPKATLIEAIKVAHPQSWEALDPIVGAECLICSESRIDDVDKLVVGEW